MAKCCLLSPINKILCEKIENQCQENKLESTPLKSYVTSIKIESTPNKINNPIDSNDTSDKDINNQEDTHLFDSKKLLESSLSPIFKTLNSQRNSANSDQNSFTLELCNKENSKDINLLHDLNSLVRFEDKDIWLSSIYINDSLLDINEDPATDPLSISDLEKKNFDTFTNSSSNCNRKHKFSMIMEEEDKSQCKKQKLNTKEKHLLNKLKNIDEWEEMPLNDIKKLMELRINLMHKVPPQHKIELSGSHAPTRKERMLFQKHGPIRKGLYSPIEDKTIKKNWEIFCKCHDWDTKKVEPFLYWRHNGRYYIPNVKERQKFVQFLANGLPWRTLYSVYSRFKVLYRKKIINTRYTSKEDKKILMYIQNEHLDARITKYSELAKILNRTNRSIYQRYQYLKKQDESDTESLTDIKWTLPLIKKFIKTLLNVTLSEDIKELKDAILPKSVWQKMEEKLCIHHNVMKTFWCNQLHLQLFSVDPIYLNDIKIQLIEYMYAKGISNTREIIWPNVAKHFDGATSVFLCKVFYYLVQECDMNNVDNFADVVEYLYHTKIPEIQKAPTDKYLPKIVYKNGKVSLIRENTMINVK